MFTNKSFLRFGRVNATDIFLGYMIYSIHSIFNFHRWRVQVAQSLKSKIDSLRVDMLGQCMMGPYGYI